MSRKIIIEMEELFELVKSYTGISESLQIKLYKTLITGLIIWTLSKIGISMVHRWVDDVKKQYTARKTIKRVSFFLFILLVANLWVVKLKSLATFFGLFSAGLAIALKDPITDLAGWLFIVWRKPFKISDRIQIGEHKGDVIDIRSFQFTLIEIGNWVNADQSTGRVIHIPNASIFQYKLANYTTGFQYIWDEIGVMVTFESDWEKAKNAINEITKHHTSHIVELAHQEILSTSRKYMIFYKNLTPRVYTSVEESGVMLTARYLVASKQRRLMREKIWESILRDFGKTDTIDFAYPSVRYYDNRAEGKKPLRAD